MLSEEHKRKIGLGSRRTMESRPNFSMRGHHHSEEAKKKMSISAKKRGFTEEWRKNIGLSRRGIHYSEETRKKMSIAHRGEKAYNWKGGSEHYKTGYHSLEYRQWRMKVFKRDNFTCQICEKVGVYLTAHHIKSFAKFPELRFDIDNGITLCDSCHKLTDNYKGKNKGK